MKKYFLLLCLFVYVCSFNIIQRIAKFRDEHLKLLIQKDEANENVVKPIQNQAKPNITVQKPVIPVKPKSSYKSKYNSRKNRKPKKDL